MVYASSIILKHYPEEHVLLNYSIIPYLIFNSSFHVVEIINVIDLSRKSLIIYFQVCIIRFFFSFSYDFSYSQRKSNWINCSTYRVSVYARMDQADKTATTWQLTSGFQSILYLVLPALLLEY